MKNSGLDLIAGALAAPFGVALIISAQTILSEAPLPDPPEAHWVFNRSATVPNSGSASFTLTDQNLINHLSCDDLSQEVDTELLGISLAKHEPEKDWHRDQISEYVQAMRFIGCKLNYA